MVKVCKGQCRAEWRLRKLKKKFTNSLLLSAVGTNNYNHFHMRLCLVVGKFFKKQLLCVAREKQTPALEACYKRKVAMAPGRVHQYGWAFRPQPRLSRSILVRRMMLQP